MKHQTKTKRTCFVAVVLGLAACGTTLLSYSIEPKYLIPAGNIFLFIAAGAIGTLGAGIALVAAKIPELLLAGNYLEVVRTSLIVGLWAYLASKNSRYSGFPVTVLLWIAVGVPTIAILNQFHQLPTGMTATTIAGQAFTDVFLSLITGALLLNQNLWITLAQRPRRFSLSQLLTHVVTLTAVAAMACAFTLPQLGMSLITQGETPVATLTLIVAFALAVIIPAFVSVRLSDLIRRSTREMFTSTLLHPSRELTFSGLSSSFWRRQKSEESTSHTFTSGDSDTKLMIQSVGKSQISPDVGICAVDNLGTVTFTNRRFPKLLQIKDREITGKKLDSIPMHQVLQEQILKLFRETQQGGSRVVEVKLNRLPDNLRYFEIRTERADQLEGSSLADTAGSVIITVKDITDRRAIETQLLQAQKLASLGNFTAGLGHVCNNALTSIIGKASFAQLTTDAHQREQALLDIVISARRIGDRVKQLMDFAEGSPSLFQDHDIKSVLEERAGLLQDLVGDKFSVVIAGTTEPIGINGDVNLLFQAITNLVLNARDAYFEKDGTIEISIDRETVPEQASTIHVGARAGTFARLRVRDHGVGMTPDVLCRAFDPLFSTKRAQGGTGLGLSTVYAIVRAHDGFLTVESSPGKGTTISVYLPLIELKKRREVSNSQSSSDDSIPHGSGKILVVEDESYVRDFVAQMLELLGYEVSSCASGDEALQEFQQKDFDLVLVDMAMPKMDGPELIERLRELNQQTKTLLMTGYGDSANNVHSPILSKPFDLETLAQTVRTAIRTEAHTTDGSYGKEDCRN